jgi:uncharacterized protein (TIGR00255 family)
MSGSAGASVGDGPQRFQWSLTSVNAKGLEVRVRLPPGLERLEPAIRSAIGGRLHRGTVTVLLTADARTGGGEPGLEIDLALVERLLDAGRPWVQRGEVAPARWDGLLQVRGVVSVRAEPANAGPDDADLMAGLAEALDQLVAARQREGATIAGALGGLIGDLESLQGQAARRSEGAAERASAELLRRIEAIATRPDIDPDRLAQEAVLAAMRGDCSEELQRIAAHCAEARRLIGAEEARIGRRLDFLVQEFMRETNTFCAKAADLDMTRLGLEMKMTVDRMREQVANVE